MDHKRQIKYNKCLEETSGLMMEISNLILMDFSNYLGKLSSIEEPKKERFNDAEVIDEEKNFFFNIKLYADCNAFLKGCFEIYSILVKQLENMIIPPNLNKKLIQFISRCRLNISNLIFTAKNEDINFQKDQKIIGKNLEIVTEINKKEMESDYMDKYVFDIKQKKVRRKAPLPKFDKNEFNEKNNKHIDLTEKIRRQFVFKLNDENQRKLRLNGVLNR